MEFFFVDYKESIPQKTVVGDVTDIDDIGRAMTSVDYVIHCCSHVDVKMFPDPDLLEKTNVHGNCAFSFQFYQTKTSEA